MGLLPGLGPAGAAVFLTGANSAGKQLKATLLADRPLPIWAIPQPVAISEAVPHKYTKFLALDLAGTGTAALVKRNSLGVIQDCAVCDCDLVSALTTGHDRNPKGALIGTDLADAIGLNVDRSVGDPWEPVLRVNRAHLYHAFVRLVRGLEPMLRYARSFGYATIVVSCDWFDSEDAAALFIDAARSSGDDTSFVLVGSNHRYRAVLHCTEASAPGTATDSGNGVTSRGRTLTVTAQHETSYEIRHVSKNVFDLDDRTLADVLECRPTLIVIDEFVYSLYGLQLKAYAAAHINSVGLIRIDGTEPNKSWHQAEAICAAAIRFGLRRDGVVVAVGGGVTLDIAGLAASLYRRGVRYVRIPTTLVGLVDVGVGIKHAVNFESRKNILGTFYAPIASINDSSFLSSLPRRHLSCGIAEMVKIALICDACLFSMLEANVATLLASKFTAPKEVADECIARAERSMVNELHPNLFEHNLRRMVDFGHTFSPTLEMMSHNQLAHGEAVAVDMAMSTAIAVERRICDSTILERLLEIYREADLPAYHHLCRPEILCRSLEEARVHRGGDLNLVVPSAIGAATFLQDVGWKDIVRAVDRIVELQLEILEGGDNCSRSSLT